MARRLTRRSFGAGLVDEHDVAVEIALLAGDALVDRVGNDVREAAPIFGRRYILLPGSKRLAAENIPEAELRLVTPVGLTRKAPDDQRLGIDGAPALEVRLRIEGGDLFDEGGGIDRNEQSAALQVRGDDLRDAVRRIGIARGDRDEFRDSDRHRLKIAAGDVDVDLRGARGAPIPSCAAPSTAKRKRAPARHGGQRNAGNRRTQFMMFE